MALIRFGGFRGELPRIHPRLLPEGGAQEAVNTRLDSGAVESVKDGSSIAAYAESDSISLYRYSDSVWLYDDADTDWVPYPLADDSFGRVIFADPTASPAGLRVTDASLVGSGGYPSSWYQLEVPAPEQGFSATLQGTADDAEEVPETRFYVCTFVNSWGAEGPPSPPSNEVEWRTGQTVLLESLPAVPTGAYNITHRRIYRVNTGSTGTTNYQFVTEIATTAAVKSVQSITQANPIVVTTTTAHGLSNGQEVIFSGLSPESAQNIVSPGISTANPARVNVTGHGLTTNEAVQFDGLGGGNGMDELDGERHQIIYVDDDRFDLLGVDSSAYTPWVSGGTVTQVHGMDELDGNSYVVEVIDSVSFSLVGIDGTGYKEYFDNGSVQQVAGTSYTDTIATAALGEVLPTELYDPPNEDTIGIKTHPSGFLAGFFGKTLAFSEPGAPHAWPIDYRLVTQHDIVGLGVFGNTVAVLTKGWPYLAVGSDPAAMTMVELEVEQSCAAKRSIVDFGTAIAYASPDGLIVLSGSGATNATAGIFTRDQWQALVPSSFTAFNWEQKYLCFYDNGAGVTRGFIIDPFDPAAGIRYVSEYVQGGYKDIEEDILYLISSPTSTEITDNFNRATLGTDWETAAEWGEAIITNNTLTAAALGTSNFSWYLAATLTGADQFAEVNISAPLTEESAILGVILRGDGAVGDGPFGPFKGMLLFLVWDGTGDSSWRLMSWDPTGVGIVIEDSDPFDPAADYSDQLLRAESIGNEHRIYLDGVLVHSMTDDNIPTGAYVGIVIQENAGPIGAVYLDNFRAGELYAIQKWDQGSKLEYTWKSAPIYMPNALNMAGAKIIADDYPVTFDFYVDDVLRYTRVVGSSKAFRLPGGFQGEKFEVEIRSKERVSEVAVATSMRELAQSV